MHPSLRGVLFGAIAGLLAGVLFAVISLPGCASDQESRRALSVADCVARLAIELPLRELPRHPAEITEDDLILVARVMEGVQSCKRALVDGGP